MKSIRLLILSLLFCLNVLGQSIPDQANFCLSDVLAITGGTCLSDAFTNSDAAKFDPINGTKTMNPQLLGGFRNYGYTGTAYDNWYLPSRAEEQLMYDNLGPSGSHNFGNDYYWSSEEYEIYWAWSRTWVNGTEAFITKGTLDHVRPVRAFTSVSPSYNIGDEGPAGGWIFYKSGNDYKEALRADLWEECTWANAITTCNDLITYH